jgi:MATE family multidrug resistance protein
MWIIYTNAIKGAGDTVFAMVAGVLVAWLAMALPAWMVYRMTESVWWIWVVLVGHVVLSAGVFYARYRYGPWRHMRVIEY